MENFSSNGKNEVATPQARTGTRTHQNKNNEMSLICALFQKLGQTSLA
jgi:hypothetical protein